MELIKELLKYEPKSEHDKQVAIGMERLKKGELSALRKQMSEGVVSTGTQLSYDETMEIFSDLTFLK